MEKKSSIKDVYQHIKQDLPQIYKSLSAKLGDENPFAKFSIGAGTYVWADNRCEWYPMNDASELKQEAIREAYAKLRNEMSKKLGSKAAEALFTTPDDSFIYYNDDDIEIKILITGWGFKKPVRVSSLGDMVKRPDKNPVKISFIRDGERLQNYAFALQLPKQTKQLATDGEGFFLFPNVEPGESYVLTDLQQNKDYQLNVVEGQSQYDFDITSFTRLTISATKDGEPLVNEKVTVTYKGKSVEAKTDENGIATIKLPYYENETIVAKVRDEEKSETVDEAGNSMAFVFDTVKEPEPPIQKDIKVIFHDLNNQPIACQNVIFRQNGKQDMTAILDEQGETVFSENVFEVGTPIEVTINGWKDHENYPPIPFTLDKDEYEYLLQEEAQMIEPPGWLYTLLEILAVVAGLVGVLVLWPFFEEFCINMFDKIY